MKLKKGDFIIIIFIIISIILYIIINNTSTDIGNKIAIIKVNGKIYKNILLNNIPQKNEIIYLENGGFINLIYDLEGIQVESVSCPDKVCKNTGKITKYNQSIVCIPNKTIIYIDKDNKILDSQNIDGISY